MNDVQTNRQLATINVPIDQALTDQFKQGIRIKPIVINQIPGAQARKQKLRRMSPAKVEILRKHIDTLIKQGVIEELDCAVDTYASPVHLVIEERYVASKQAVVTKGRVTVDCREINKTLPGSSYPLPLCDQFRYT